MHTFRFVVPLVAIGTLANALILNERFRTALFQMLKLVPDAAWGALTGSVITLIGVWISNKGNTDRLMKQLDIDTTQKAVARKFDARKAVYLDAVAAVVKAARCIGDLPQYDIEEDARKDLEGMQESFAKITLIAGPPATLAALELSQAVHLAFTALHFKSIPIRRTTKLIKDSEANIAKEKETQKQSIGRAHLEEEQGINNFVHGIVNRRLQESNEYIKAVKSEIEKLKEDRNSLLVGFRHAFDPHYRTVNAAQTRLMVAIRDELGVDSKDPALEAFFKQQFEATMVMLEEPKGTK